MKKIFLTMVLAAFTAACAQTETTDGAAMCAKTHCCHMTAEGKPLDPKAPCPMMKNKKPCECCQKAMKEEAAKKKAAKKAKKAAPAATGAEGTKATTPAKK